MEQENPKCPKFNIRNYGPEYCTRGICDCWDSIWNECIMKKSRTLEERNLISDIKFGKDLFKKEGVYA